jgi:nucleoside 2-deoxyribosyltransferase
MTFTDASAAEVRAALIPEEAAEFEGEWRSVMAMATDTFDLAELLAMLESWRRVARLTVAVDAEAHRAMYRRAAERLTGEAVPPGEPLAETKGRLGL